MKTPEIKSALLLLDDTEATPNQALESITNVNLRPRAKATPKQTAPATKVPDGPLGRRKVFSSQKTLQQMMQEYNRPTARLAPIKSESGQGTAGNSDSRQSPPTPDDFASDRLRRITLPGITGKILRPAPKRSC